MARYASEKYALGISDRSGVAYKLRDMRMAFWWEKMSGSPSNPNWTYLNF